MNRGGSAAPSTDIGLPYNKNMADIAEWCYVPTRVLLESFAAVLQANHLPVFKKGHFGTYNPKADRERMPLGERFNEDKIILLSTLPNFCMLDTFKIQMPTEDALTRGLADFAKNKHVTLWLCFASQIFLDVHHTMRDSALGAFADLRMSGLRIMHPPPKFWPKGGDMEIQGISNTVESWIIKDLFHDLRPRQTPYVCGLFLFNLNLRMHFVGQHLLTQWYDIQQLAFLYNLVVKSSPVHKSLSWPDMDAASSWPRASHPPPIFARDSRNKNEWHKPNGKDARVLTLTTAVAKLFFEQYVSSPDPFAGAAAGLAGFDTILDQLAQQKSKLESSSSAPTKKQKQRRKQLQNRPNPELSIARTWSTTHNIDTLHLLAFLKTKLFEEEPVILYNYFGMHKRAVELLRLIRDKEHHKFVQGGNEICSRIVLSAADVMRDYLARNGAVACKELRVFCKNKPIVRDGGDDEQGNLEQDQLVYSWLSLEDVVGPKRVAALQTGIPIA
ncbi:hypothetical protein BJX62DRAFT_223195 [Aspergillus germanicus]